MSKQNNSMKPIATIALLFLLAGCHHPGNTTRLAAIKNLPHLRMIALDSSTRFLPEDVPPGSPVIIIYFDPDCEHCQRETIDLIQHRSEIEPAKVYMVANNATHDSLQRFYRQNRLEQSSNILIGEDYNYSFFKVFKPSTVPYIIIYNSNQQLVKIYEGEADIHSIIASIRS
jgi:hypothetical protein